MLYVPFYSYENENARGLNKILVLLNMSFLAKPLTIWQLSWYLAYDYKMVRENRAKFHGDENNQCLNEVNLPWLHVLGHAIHLGYQTHGYVI